MPDFNADKFKCPTPDGFFPIPGACSNSYYSCVAGTPHIQVGVCAFVLSNYGRTHKTFFKKNCPGNAIFDPASHFCVSEQTASCTSISVITIRILLLLVTYLYRNSNDKYSDDQYNSNNGYNYYSNHYCCTIHLSRDRAIPISWKL